MEARRVDVGGYELSAHVRGGEGVPVVFVSGLGETHKAWKPVLDLLPDSLRTITYDRAGIGESDPYPPARRVAVTYRQAANDLRSMLLELSISAPWLLVGHSYGGCIIRSVADDYPADVAGTVLVDPSVAELSLPRELERHYREEERDVIHDGDLDHSCQIDARSSATQLRSERLPNAPSVVLTRARDEWGKPVPPEVDDYWYAQHAALSEKLNAWQIVALTAGHRIQEDEPALVARAVTVVTEAVSGGNPRLGDDETRNLGGYLQRVPAN